MSEQNVEIVRRALEAVFRKPKPDFETINALYHPDHEMVSMIQRLEGGVLRGASGYRDWLAENDEAWERWDNSLEQIRSIDNARVLVETVSTVLSKRAGLPLEQSFTTIFTLREGKIVRTEIYSSREAALEAAGIEE